MSRLKNQAELSAKELNVLRDLRDQAIEFFDPKKHMDLMARFSELQIEANDLKSKLSDLCSSIPELRHIEKFRRELADKNQVRN